MLLKVSQIPASRSWLQLQNVTIAIQRWVLFNSDLNEPINSKTVATLGFYQLLITFLSAPRRFKVLIEICNGKYLLTLPTMAEHTIETLCYNKYLTRVETGECFIYNLHRKRPRSLVHS